MEIVLTRKAACLAFLAIVAMSLSTAFAADGAPPEAKKEGGIAGDPSGAIRALGGNSQDDFREGTNKVDVPKLGGSVGAGRVDGPPAGIAGKR